MGQSMAEMREDALAEIGLAYPYAKNHVARIRRSSFRSKQARSKKPGDIFWLDKAEIERWCGPSGWRQTLGGFIRTGDRAERDSFRAPAQRSPPHDPDERKSHGDQNRYLHRPNRR
jgi:hypothetical protein